MKSKPLVLSAIFIACYFVLNLIVIIKMPQGGSASLCSTLFLVLPAFIFGKKYGFIAPLIAGLMSFAFNPYFLSPTQFFLDYILAYQAWSIGSYIFSNKTKFALEKYYITGLIFSLIFATTSGVVFFAEYAPEGMNPLWYSLTYNGSYKITEGILVLIVLQVPALKNALTKEISNYNK